MPASLLSALSGLATYLVVLDERGRGLLLAVAPHVAEQHSAVIADVLSATIEAHVPAYDYEDRLRKLLNTLASNGKKNEVLRMLDRLLSLPGMHDLFNELTRSVTRANNELLSG